MSTTVDLGKITASVTVGTTTTGAAGTNASVSNSGTTQDAVLNFTIPRGAQGVQGPQGSTGPQGPAGPTGPQGPMGDVAVITPEQQAAFTMYSVPGQNTDGPMTQKAVTDALANTNKVNAFTYGKIAWYDNTRKFVIEGGNLVLQIKGNQYIINEGTEYIPPLTGITSLSALCYNISSQSLVLLSRASLTDDMYVLAFFARTSYYTSSTTPNTINIRSHFIDAIVPTSVNGKMSLLAKEITWADNVNTVNGSYINATTGKWTTTNVHTDASLIVPISMGDIVTVYPNYANNAVVMLLNSVDIVPDDDADIIASYNSISEITDIIAPKDCYLYVLNYTSKLKVVRWPDGIFLRKSNMISNASFFGSYNKFIADNPNKRFFLQSNIVYNGRSGQYIIPAGTVIPYVKKGGILALVFDDENLTFVEKAWKDVTPTDIVFMVFTFGLNVVNEMNVTVVDYCAIDYEVIGGYSYSGEKPIFAEKKFSRTSIIDLPAHGSDGGLYPKVHQGFAVYDQYIVLLTFNKNVTPQTSAAILYDMITGEKLAEINLPLTINGNTYYRPHGNACIFSKTFHSNNSALPLLYVSQWEQEYEKGFLVYDITLSNGVYSATLVQTIKPTNVSAEYIGVGALDWTADFDNNVLYSVSYTVLNGSTVDNNNTNPTMICQYSLPAVVSNTEVILGDNDIVEHYTIESTPYRQGVSFNNGKLMISSGVDNHASWMWVKMIDVSKKKIVTRIPLNAFGGEVEGIDVYQGSLILGWRGDGNIYRLEFY